MFYAKVLCTNFEEKHNNIWRMSSLSSFCIRSTFCSSNLARIHELYLGHCLQQPNLNFSKWKNFWYLSKKFLLCLQYKWIFKIFSRRWRFQVYEKLYLCKTFLLCPEFLHKLNKIKGFQARFQKFSKLQKRTWLGINISIYVPFYSSQAIIYYLSTLKKII